MAAVAVGLVVEVAKLIGSSGLAKARGRILNAMGVSCSLDELEWNDC